MLGRKRKRQRLRSCQLPAARTRELCPKFEHLRSALNARKARATGSRLPKKGGEGLPPESD
jgi:hypothetical protein